MSPFGTKREFSPERMKGRKPPHSRRTHRDARPWGALRSRAQIEPAVSIASDGTLNPAFLIIRLALRSCLCIGSLPPNVTGVSPVAMPRSQQGWATRLGLGYQRAHSGALGFVLRN